MANGPKLKARTILESARSSAKSFLEAFDTVRQHRGAAIGKPTHEQQDLLRASLVFAGAGLDSMLKQLIRETIKQLADKDERVRRELTTFVQRQIRGDPNEVETTFGHRFMATVLLSPSPMDGITAEYVRDLTGSSLQSQEQLLKAARALGLDTRSLELDAVELKTAFQVRNRIIHELDVNLNTARGRHSRQGRTRKELEVHTNRLLDAGEKIIEGVENKLRSEG